MTSVRARLVMVASTGSRHLRALIEQLSYRRAARRRRTALRLIERGELDAAFTKFEEALAICPTRLDWLAEYGRVAIKKKRWAVAKSALDRALAERPGVARWYALRARALVGLGQHDAAIQDYRAALALDPGHGSWLVGLGRALAASGAVADGAAALARAVELDATKVDWWAALAGLQRRAGATGDAVDSFGRALAIRAQPKWYALRARLLAEVGREHEAIAEFRHALDLDPTETGCWVKLAHLLASAGRAGEAVEAYRAALAGDDRQAGTHARLARLLAARGEIDDAIEHFTRAVALDGRHPSWWADLNELRELACSGAAAMPAAEKDAEWYDTVYHHSQKYRLGYQDTTYWPVWQKILERLATFGRPSILEIGCGPGQLAAAIRDRVAASAYLGIDFSGKAIEMARRSVPNFRFVVGNALDAPDLDRFPYDLVICTEVLEHIERDRDVIRRWRPGASVIATVPSYDAASHVRHFPDIDAVRDRYAGLIHELSVEQIPIGPQSSIFLMCGRVAERT